MAETTNIAWCDSTFNPWIGCTKVSPGCDHCYAEARDKRHLWGDATHWGQGVPRHRTSADYWKQPLSWDWKVLACGKPWRVFCASLADVFDNEVPEEWRLDLWRLIDATPNLTWLLLTKRIGNAAKMLREAWPSFTPAPNIWLGASVVNQEEADRDIPKLLGTPAMKRFVSYEPALGPVNWSPWLSPTGHINWGENKHPSERDQRAVLALAKAAYRKLGGRLLDWIIVGGESAQGGAPPRPFDLAWARSTVQQCHAAGVASFVKQLGSNAVRETPHHDYGQFLFKNRAGADPAEWPEDLRVQEFPL
jgi:protein gp37